MREMREAKDPTAAANRRKPVLLIILLGVLLFLVLYFLFGQRTDRPGQGDRPSPSPADPGAPLSPGKIELSSPQENQASASASPPAAEKEQTVTSDAGGEAAQAAEDFTFFRTLKEKTPAPASDPFTDKSPPRSTETPPPPKAPPTASRAKPFTIQVGSFQRERSAQALHQRLEKKGYPSYIMTSRLPEKGTVYRVRIGRYASLPEAQGVAQKLRERERLNYFIAKTDG